MFNREKLIRSISLGMATTVLMGAGLLSGCTAAPENKGPGIGSTPPAVQDDKNDKIMPEFYSMLGENPKPDRLIGFIDKNISAVSREDASKMLVELERAQQNFLPQLEVKYFDEASVEEELRKLYSKDFDLNRLDEVQDAQLKKLLIETGDMGYRVETAEGSFFPILNYEYLKRFSAYAGDDIRAYVDIMAVESAQVPAKDAALVIGWEEVVERVLAQEAYLELYGSSVRAEAVKELQKKYLTFMLYGLNNTPLFSYQDNTMDKKAREAYRLAVSENEGSRLMKLLGEFMDLAEKSDYKLSDKLNSFRKEAVENNN